MSDELCCSIPLKTEHDARYMGYWPAALKKLCLKAYNLSGVLIHVRGLRTAPIQVLTENEVQELHEASLNIL